MDPGQWNAFKSHLPQSLVKDIELDRVIFDTQNLSIHQIVRDSTTYTYPDLRHAQQCENKVTGSSLSTDEHEELSWAVKWACIAYTLPWMFRFIPKYLHLPNRQFNERMLQVMQEHHFDACLHYDTLLVTQVAPLALPEDTSVAGYFIHTPLKVSLPPSKPRASKRGPKKSKPLNRLPERKEELEKLDIRGYMNVYVLRYHVSDDEHELMVLFRGTSNDFHAPPQFGNQFRRTQVFSFPSRCTVDQSDWPEGSETRPLYTPYYSEMLLDVKDHIYHHLERLDVSGAERILVTGHSMGGALTILFCDYLKREHPSWWAKTDFRPVASPLVMNDAAVVQMEQWFIDNRREYQYMELVNSDDIVHVEYQLGGRDAFKTCIQSGIKSLMSWAVHMTQPSMTSEEISRVITKYPDTAASFFIRGFLRSQVVSQDKRSGFRMARRADEVSHWGHPRLASLYNKTVNLYYCDRHIDWSTEYTGRSHADYMDMSTNVFWTSLRLWEEMLYRQYQQLGLDRRNPLILLPMFPERDLSSKLFRPVTKKEK
jgi:hypothetical protein